MALPVASLTIMAFVPETSTPPTKPSHLIVIDLVMVTPPKPPESRQLISPSAAVFEIVPGKVLHGAVRLHGFASSPTPDTHVRVAWAKAGRMEGRGGDDRKDCSQECSHRICLSQGRSSTHPLILESRVDHSREAARAGGWWVAGWCGLNSSGVKQATPVASKPHFGAFGRSPISLSKGWATINARPATP